MTAGCRSAPGGLVIYLHEVYILMQAPMSFRGDILFDSDIYRINRDP